MERRIARDATIFIDNLPNQMQQTWWGDIFNSCGKVDRVIILRKSRIRSNSRYMFVKFCATKYAIKAVQKYNDVWCLDKRLKIMKARFRSQKMSLGSRTYHKKSCKKNYHGQISQGGVILVSPQDIGMGVMEYFSKTFKEVVPDRHVFRCQVLKTLDMGSSSQLEFPFTEEEILKAVK
ncbi:hypothetical protein U1Q18_032961 [Sarracenia purpurea var. burkii]